MTYDPQRPPGGTGAGPGNIPGNIPGNVDNLDDLQFDRAETAPPAPSAPTATGLGEPVPTTSAPPAVGAPGVTVCAACGEPIADVYFEGNGKVVCPPCRDAVVASQTGGSAVARLFKATLFGLLGGAVGATIWWAVRHFTGYEVGYVAVAVGFLVGGAVKAGADKRGGIAYQLLAVVLTYLAIAANYIPDIVHELRTHTEIGGNTVVLVIVTAVTALLAPFLGGLKNIIGLVIIAIGLWFAWKINRPTAIRFNGPFRLAGGGPARPVGLGAFPPAPSPYGPPPPPPMGRA